MGKIFNFIEKNKSRINAITIIILIILFIMPFVTTRRVERGAAYTKKEDVALYIMEYHELPHNYITKYGLDYAKNNNIKLNQYVMGGDTHFNTEQLKQFGISKSANLKECDIAGKNYVIQSSRGGERLVYTCNTGKVRVFYTYNHYKTFTELTRFSLNLTRNIFWIVFGVYTAGFIAFHVMIAVYRKKQIEN